VANLRKMPGAIVIEGHIQGLSLTRTLGEKGIPVYVVDRKSCISKYSRYCQKFIICPDFKEDSLADFLINLAEDEKLKDWILLPTNDLAVITLSRNKLRLEKYFKMMVPEFTIIEQIYNKATLLTIAAELDVPVPDTYCFIGTEVGNAVLVYPVITKGKHGLDFYRALKKKALIAYNKEELKKQLERIKQKYILDDCLTQTVIQSGEDNKTTSFTAFALAGEIKTYWIGLKRREHPLRFGTATFAESIKEPELFKMSEKLIKHLAYNGVCEIEYLKDPRDKQFKLIEINARTWLWVGLAKACGVDYGFYIYNYLNGIVNNYPQDYRTDIKWINFPTDLLFSIRAYFKSLITFKDYLRSMRGEKVKALYYKGDNKPMFAYYLLAFSFLRNR
jgi:D-aspartate ligase